MADCSKTEIFISEWNRMHDSFAGCSGCGLYNEYFTCVHYVMGNPKKAKEIIQKWSDEHPLPKPKTYADDFFEKYPDARCIERSFKHNGDLVPRVMRCAIYKGCGHTQAYCETPNRVQCWLEQYEG